MAALGKIRSRGVTLIIIIGLGLFAFIAEEAFRSCNGIKGEANQQVGEVLGKKISVQDYQKLVDDVTNAQKALSGTDNLSEDQLNQLRDGVWQQYVTYAMVENDAKKVGLTVTDDEVNNVLKDGTNPLLQRDIPIPQFYNQQTGRFDYSIVQQFLADYDKAIKANPQMADQIQQSRDLWLYCEQQLRHDLLQQKYSLLVQASVLSNKAEAKLAFKDENEEATIQLASFAYSDIKDNSIKITDEDLKAKYEELKPAFKQLFETRDLKYVAYQIKASAADRNALVKEMNDYQKQLSTAADPEQVIGKSQSQIAYLGVPVSKDAFPQDIANKLDSMAVGTSGVFETKSDNTLNIIKLVAKQELPDSVQYRQIQVGANTVDEARAKADSITKALEGGAKFEDIAKKYGQEGKETWFTGQMYEHSTSMNDDSRKLINALLTGEVNKVQNLAFDEGNVIVQVLDKKGMKEKYTAGVIKKIIDFSKDTRSAAYNKFSEFVTKSTTLDALQKNARKYGYTVLDQNDLQTSAHKIGNVGGSGIKDALKWVWKAKEGEISPLYEAGDNDYMLVIYLNKIHPQGYRSLDDPQVKEIVKREVLKDKKAEQIIAKLKGVNSVKAAQAKGGKVSTVDKITFASPAYVQATGSVEPALSGAVARTAKGKFVSAPVKGNAGVYVFQVINKAMRAGAKYNEQQEMQSCAMQSMQILQGFMNDLTQQAGIVDNRYLFF